MIGVNLFKYAKLVFFETEEHELAQLLQRNSIESSWSGNASAMIRL
nr:hypothetical protein [Peribacillus butanolivorans]